MLSTILRYMQFNFKALDSTHRQAVAALIRKQVEEIFHEHC